MPNKLRQLSSLSFKVSLRSCINQIMKTTLLWLVHGTHLCFTRVNFAQGKCQLSPQKMQANLWQISLCCHRTRHGLLWFDVQFHRLIMFQVHHEEILQRYDNHKFREILHVLNSNSHLGHLFFLRAVKTFAGIHLSWWFSSVYLTLRGDGRWNLMPYIDL